MVALGVTTTSTVTHLISFGFLAVPSFSLWVFLPKWPLSAPPSLSSLVIFKSRSMRKARKMRPKRNRLRFAWKSYGRNRRNRWWWREGWFRDWGRFLNNKNGKEQANSAAKFRKHYCFWMFLFCVFRSLGWFRVFMQKWIGLSTLKISSGDRCKSQGHLVQALSCFRSITGC